VSSTQAQRANRPWSPASAETVKRVVERARWVGGSVDLPTVSRRLVAVVEELLEPARGFCLMHDATDGSLWSETSPELGDRAVSGAIGLAIRTVQPQVLDRCETDPRWDADLDHEFATGSQRMLVHPVHDSQGEVHAVLVAVREARAAPFSPEEAASIALLADCAGPLLHNLCLALEADDVLRQTQDSDAGLFRNEVVVARRQPRQWGELVRVLPAWLPWTYRLLVGLAIGTLVYSIVGRVDVYSAGPAVVQLHDRTEVTTPRSGSLATVYVQPGDVVERGEVVARFEDDVARGDLERIERGWAAQLRRRMFEPTDTAAREEVARLWQQLADARAAVSEHEVRAPFDGTISDLRIRSGQFMNAGDVLMSISRNEESRRVVALLPGRDRPRLSAGMTMRLEFPGYPRNFQYLVVDSIGDEVIGPAEARRFLGPAVSDALQLSGSLVVVHARLAQSQFEAEGDSFRFHDGMNATAEVRVRSKAIIEVLIPGLEGMWPHG
jgi:multidrug efflux pump subunit AcrA (membrane-fusion protein)